MQVKIEPIKIEGIKYISVKEMAIITNKSDQTIYTLISKGNSVRKMNHIKIGTKVLIPYTEVIEFPFTWAGRYTSDSNNIYHYTYDGEIVEETFNEKDQRLGLTREHNQF